MNANLEKLITLLVIGAFMITSINLLTAPTHAVTKEEAIETSKKAELVRDSMAKFGNVRIGEASYYNASWVERLKTGHNKAMYLKVPSGHGIWEMVWSVHMGVGGYLIIVVVDAETDIIVHEELGVGWRLFEPESLRGSIC